jgi:hypothetical protein
VLIFPKQILLAFLAETKKRVFIKFLLTKTYWILANQKKQKGSVLAEKLGIRIISNERFRIG